MGGGGGGDGVGLCMGWGCGGCYELVRPGSGDGMVEL